MFHLVYASSATKLLSGSELLALLSRARVKNQQLGITGLLLYKEGAFMQALEGEEDDVRSLYAKICQDQRHHHVNTLAEVEMSERHFPDWSMAFKNMDDVNVNSAAGYREIQTLPVWASHFLGRTPGSGAAGDY